MTLLATLTRRRADRRADDDRRVLAVLRHSDPAGLYDLWTRTGLRSVRLCRALDRLMDAGVVRDVWDNDGPRPRRLWRVTEVARGGAR